MGRNNETSALVDGLLKALAGGIILSAAITAPNSIQVLDKPLQHFLERLDKRERERELKRLAAYMRKRGLIRGTYEHGLIITKAGRQRAKKDAADKLTIAQPKEWDKSWRLVLFDIPETKRDARAALTNMLRSLGFQLLQQSVWIHPFPCREQVETLCVRYGVAQWVSYIETSHIDHDHILQKRFAAVFRGNNFGGR